MIVVAAVAAAAWLWLLCLRGTYWRTDQRLPRRRAQDSWPNVGIVVPARDEAEMLAGTVPALRSQEYPGAFRLVVVDDGSTDGTAEIARSLGASVVESTPVPPEWSGKLWALHRGVRELPECEYLLFTDADIRHSPDSLKALVESARTGDYALVSQMARLRTESRWERLIVPAFVYFFGLLYPFRWVNCGKSAAAAGGCVLIERAALELAGGIAVIRSEIIDDVALGRLIRRSGRRIWLGLADSLHSVRLYPDLGSLWRMVSRSAYAQLRYSPWLLAGTVAGLALLFLVPPAALATGIGTGDLVVGLLGGLTWLLLAALYVPMLRYYRRSVLAAALLPFTATLYAAMTLDSARGRGTSWKGRPDPARR